MARQLFEEYRRRHHESYLAVGTEPAEVTDEYVIVLSGDTPRERWARRCMRAGARIDPQGRSRVARLLVGATAEPDRWIARRRGREWFGYPTSRRLLSLTPKPPDIVHCHNLHGAFLPRGGYFDLRALPELSRRCPLVMTLHDAWLLSGHCAQSLDCERWRSGCGSCPDLTLYAPLLRDGTAGNWLRKREILMQSRVHVATPSAWLMRKVEASIVAAGAVERRVIPNGVDTTVFAPADRAAAADALDLPPDAYVFVAAANEIRSNRWKDFPMLEATAGRLASEIGDARPIVVLAVGSSGETLHANGAEIRFVTGVVDPHHMARIYQAAHVFLHPTRVDTFPTTVLEALACGLPVVASAVGGVPEQIRPLAGASAGCASPEAATSGLPTGALVPVGDAAAMATFAGRIVTDTELRGRLAANAVEDARARFGLDRQANAYLDWYAELAETSGAL